MTEEALVAAVALEEAEAGCDGEVPAAAPVLAEAPRWRREPYRLFFPLGVLLAWAGVGKWLALALGWGVYSAAFHSVAQVQGFVMAFAAGFLFTAIPRRTGTAPAAPWQLAVAVLGTVGTTALGAAGKFAASQALWLLLVATLVGFAVRRFLSAKAARRPPNSFVWVPLSLVMGVAGSVLLGVYGARGHEPAWLHQAGKVLLTQCMVTGLVLGVGGMLIPMITRGEGPPDGAAGPGDRRARALHAAAAALLAGSVAVEVVAGAQAGHALRAAVCAAVLLLGAELWRRPVIPGWHRRLVWLGAWCLPLGFALAAALPHRAQAGLHVVFIGGFAALCLSVGIHVGLAHGGDERPLFARPWQVGLLGGLLLVAVAARAAMTLDPARLWTWMGLAAAAFLAATVVWGAFVGPRLCRGERA